MTFGTMEKIQTVTLTSSQTSIDFQNIPSTYNDLVIKLSVRGDRAANTTEVLGIRLNNSVTSLDTRYIQGDGSSVVSATSTTGRIAVVQGSSSTANTFSSVDIYIPNYAGSTNKSFSVDAVQENNNTEGYPVLTAGLWSNTAAINRVTLVPLFGTNWVANSTATLYGITRVPAGAKATGGVIYDDSSYWYHVFTSSGTFTPSQSMNVDYLVVAGGGGASLGGGGAGGFLTANSFAVTASANLTVTVGAGGAGNGAGVGANGSNSVFSTVTATGGGGGATLAQAGSGGSGGGAGDFGRGGRVGTGTPGQGNNGGLGATDGATWTSGGGGGGASQAGVTTTTSAGGKGGDGSASSISGTSVTYAGGGGGGAQQTGALGGAGGTGGGGTGGINNNAGTNGSANTGGGAGGGQNSAAAGGSGIVIIRYTK